MSYYHALDFHAFLQSSPLLVSRRPKKTPGGVGPCSRRFSRSSRRGGVEIDGAKSAEAPAQAAESGHAHLQPRVSDLRTGAWVFVPSLFHVLLLSCLLQGPQVRQGLRAGLLVALGEYHGVVVWYCDVDIGC